jgi:hypothetical protein
MAAPVILRVMRGEPPAPEMHIEGGTFDAAVKRRIGNCHSTACALWNDRVQKRSASAACHVSANASSAAAGLATLFSMRFIPAPSPQGGRSRLGDRFEGAPQCGG